MTFNNKYHRKPILLLDIVSTKGVKRMQRQFSYQQRKQWLKHINDNTFDVLVIGGGITGAGIALDAATRNLKVVVVEMNDYASGTSGRTSKLIHGGLKYLKQMNFRVISEISKERKIVAENAPHVTKSINICLPYYKESKIGPLLTRFGLTVYDTIAGLSKEEKSVILSSTETLNKIPYIKNENLLGSGMFSEYLTNDSRINIEVIKQAVKEGAWALNYTKVEKLLMEDGIVCGAYLKDSLTGEDHVVKAKKVINATGPWIFSLDKSHINESPLSSKWVKGSHIVFSQKRFPLEKGTYFENDEGKLMFAIPFRKSVFVGTTESLYEGDIENPQVTEEEKEYLLNDMNKFFQGLNLTKEDIISSWAGVRTLYGKALKDIQDNSAIAEIWISCKNLITVAGGKLTNYRSVAEKVVDTVLEDKELQCKAEFPKSLTRAMTLSGGDLGFAACYENFTATMLQKATQMGWKEELSKKLIKIYGGNVDIIFGYKERFKDLRDTSKLPDKIFYPLLYSVLEEQVMTPEDFFVRRTGWFYFERELVREYYDDALVLIKELLKLSDVDYKSYTEKYKYLQE
jgi:glycerol-3-phosphate dehydrogenase